MFCTLGIQRSNNISRESETGELPIAKPAGNGDTRRADLSPAPICRHTCLPKPRNSCDSPTTMSRHPFPSGPPPGAWIPNTSLDLWRELRQRGPKRLLTREAKLNGTPKTEQPRTKRIPFLHSDVRCLWGALHFFSPKPNQTKCILYQQRDW